MPHLRKHRFSKPQASELKRALKLALYLKHGRHYKEMLPSCPMGQLYLSLSLLSFSSFDLDRHIKNHPGIYSQANRTLLDSLDGINMRLSLNTRLLRLLDLHRYIESRIQRTRKLAH